MFLYPFYGLLSHTMHSAKRDRLFFGAIISIIAGACISFFFGSIAIVEQMEMQAVYTASICRYVIVFSLIIFICFHIQRMFENREIEMFVSRAMPRSHIILSLAVSFILLSLPLVLIVTSILAFISKSDGLIAWSITMIGEAWMVIVLSLFFGLLINGLMLCVMMSIGAYIACRIIGYFVGYIKINDIVTHWYIFDNIVEITIKAISIVIPRLDLCAQTKWLIHGVNDWLFVGIPILQIAIFMPIILLATIHDFNKKEF